jgi:Holliday junction resolvasome RuvABC ATP-dependent DNA helicase subunit
MLSAKQHKEVVVGYTTQIDHLTRELNVTRTKLVHERASYLSRKLNSILLLYTNQTQRKTKEMLATAKKREDDRSAEIAASRRIEGRMLLDILTRVMTDKRTTNEDVTEQAVAGISEYKASVLNDLIEFGKPVHVNEETETAGLAETERNIYHGMEAMEDAFEKLHVQAELVRKQLRGRVASNRTHQLGEAGL